VRFSSLVLTGSDSYTAQKKQASARKFWTARQVLAQSKLCGSQAIAEW